jgi:hypothetical protein
MGLILFVWACIACALLFPPPVTVFVLLGAAVLRIAYLTRDSMIDAAAETIGETVKLAQDVRRNGWTALKTLLGWLTAVAALGTVVVVFHIPF